MGKFKNECITDDEAKSEKPYKVYETPHGTFAFTKEEFDLVVEYFRTLMRWRDQSNTSEETDLK